MVIYFRTKDGYLDGYSTVPSGEEGECCIEVEDDHEVLRNPHVFKYEDGELVKDEEKRTELLNEDSTKPNKESMQSVAILELAERVATLEGGD